MDERERHAAGMKVRRNVLGDDHVDRALARTIPLTAEFQDLITRYAWGEIWTRPGLDVRARRVLVMGTLLALGRFDELRMHFRSALEERGLSLDEIKEVLLQQTIYCGVPAVNTAFEVLREVVEEADRDSAGG
jgi:4-carboxymuconolactone decarboxylase